MVVFEQVEVGLLCVGYQKNWKHMLGLQLLGALEVERAQKLAQVLGCV